MNRYPRACLERQTRAQRFQYESQAVLDPGFASTYLAGELSFEFAEAGSDFLASESGRKTWKRVSPGAEVTLMFPLCLRTILCTVSRPSPVPSPTPFVVKKGSKI